MTDRQPHSGPSCKPLADRNERHVRLAGFRFDEESEQRRDDSELRRFLDLMHSVSPNLNDTFGYATADSQRIALDEERGGNTDTLVWAFRRFGHAGVVAYCSTIRRQPPIKELQTPEYQAAMEALASWHYEDD